VFHRADGMTFQADATLRKAIQDAGGVRIDMRDGLMGPNLVIKLANARGCGC